MLKSFINWNSLTSHTRWKYPIAGFKVNCIYLKRTEAGRFLTILFLNTIEADGHQFKRCLWHHSARVAHDWHRYPDLHIGIGAERGKLKGRKYLIEECLILKGNVLELEGDCALLRDVALFEILLAVPAPGGKGQHLKAPRAYLLLTVVAGTVCAIVEFP